jgi:hypothetical protein
MLIAVIRFMFDEPSGKWSIEGRRAQGEHMLDWRHLTRGQRIGGVFLLVIFIVASPFLVFVAPTSVADRMWYTGLVLSGFGVILDPQWFRMRYGTPVNLAAMPRACRVLLGLGGTLAAVGFLMRHLLPPKG